jgi:hypothetical protein
MIELVSLFVFYFNYKDKILFTTCVANGNFRNENLRASFASKLSLV